MQKYDFKPGESFVERMHDALADGYTVIGVLTPTYIQSKWCKKEWLNASWFIPVRCANFNPTGLLATTIYIDFWGKDRSAAMEALRDGLLGVERPVEEPEFPGSAAVMADEPAYPGSLDAKKKKTYFISYTNRDPDDVEWAKWIHSVVTLRMGENAIMQEYDFRPGENFRVKMHEALTKSDYVLGVMTPTYMESDNCADEWANAKPYGFIPILCAGFKPDGILKNIIYIKVHDRNAEDAERELIKGLQGAARPTQPHPFPGEGKKKP
jgi:hypothetical protein